MDHGFVFAPGSTMTVPAGVPGAGISVERGSYSTNGFSLVGLAIAGLMNLTDWSQLDQRALAWGDQLYDDDMTLFPGRGSCRNYAGVVHQYTSENSSTPFHEVSNHSCLNSWLGGNIAARPLDIARFTHAAFNPTASRRLISDASRGWGGNSNLAPEPRPRVARAS